MQNIGEYLIKNSPTEKISVFWIQLFSMRSYETGKYDVWSDGNVVHTLHELFNIRHHLKSVEITVPVQAINTDKLENWLKCHVCANTKLIPTIYDENVASTRTLFMNQSRSWYHAIEENHSGMQVVCDYEIFFPDSYRKRVVYNWHVTNDTISTYQKDILRNRFSAYVFNIPQIRILDDMTEACPNLCQAIHWFNPRVVELLAAQGGEYYHVVNDTVFLPFRISDPDYHFEDIREFCTRNAIQILITNPNDSYKFTPGGNLIQKNDLRIHENLLQFLKVNRGNPLFKVIYLSNPKVVLHQSFLEMMTLLEPWQIIRNWDVTDKLIKDIYDTYKV